MISIKKATANDYGPIVNIGKIAVGEAHRDSTTAENLNEYLDSHYNDEAIKAELADESNVYHIIYVDDQPAGFSKIEFNANEPAIEAENITKLDRIYLLKEYFGLKLGWELLKFNIELAKNNGQSGMYLYTWTGNERAIGFYVKVGFKIIGSHKFKVTETHYNLNHLMFLDLQQQG